LQSYVTASCTDGYTYVYDTAQGDLPVHILAHGGKLFFDSLERANADEKQNP